MMALGRLTNNEEEKLSFRLRQEPRPSHSREAAMKDKKWHLVLVGFLILTCLNAYGDTKKLRDIGRYRFIPIKVGTPAAEVMKLIGEKYADDIRRGLELAGNPELYGPFMDRIGQSAYAERQLDVGTKMLWMIFRSQGEIKVIHDLEWAGKEPLPVYSFTIQEGDRKYELIMPVSCGNISLEKVEAVSAPVEEQKPVPPAPSLREKPEERYQISRAKIYQDFSDLINEVDLYCSFSVWENEIPGLKIIGAEREDEKAVFSDGDVIFLNKGQDGAVETGQIFWVLEISDHPLSYGPIAFGKGRARVQFTDANRSAAVVEHSCDGVRSGYFLVPFEAREGMMGKDLGYDNVPPVETEGPRGRLVYLQGDLRQIGSLQRALIDIGEDQGIQVGQQLILYRKIGRDLPVVILGNCIAIDVKSKTSTIKVLSCRDILKRGDLVMVRPAQ
jgi:hypothetical protein